MEPQQRWRQRQHWCRLALHVDGGSQQQQWRQTMAVAAADCLNNNGRGGSGSGNITGCIFKYMGKGEVVYSNIHVSAHVSVHIIAYYIQFNMKSGACKIKFTQIYMCKINFQFI
jgi:hypothetical protein